VLALEGAEEFKRSAPPGALAVGTAFIGLRRHNIQDARKFAFVLVLHLHGVRLWMHAQRNDANGTATYMQRSCIEHKNCSIWLSNQKAGVGRDQGASASSSGRVAGPSDS